MKQGPVPLNSDYLNPELRQNSKSNFENNFESNFL